MHQTPGSLTLPGLPQQQ